MRGYTSLEQSKKLAEILSLESADCYWDYDEMQKFHRISWFEDGYNKESQLRLNENNVCAWSLAALLGVLPNDLDASTVLSNECWDVDTMKYKKGKWLCDYVHDLDSKCHTTSADNPIDACVEMILKLKEKNQI